MQKEQPFNQVQLDTISAIPGPVEVPLLADHTTPCRSEAVDIEQAESAAGSDCPEDGGPITPDSNNEIALTIFTGDQGARLTKAYSVGEGGQIETDSTPLMVTATARQERITYLPQVEPVIENLGVNQCLATGIFDTPVCDVVPNGDLTASTIAAGLRARTLDHMTQPSPGLALLDYDGGPSMPQQLRCSKPADIMEKLARLSPHFQGIAYSGAASSSTGVINIQTGEALDKTGFHCYIIIQDVDLRVLRDWLKAKCWTAGMGYIDLGRNGIMLERCLVDITVLSPERLIYEAPPVLGEGIVRADRSWTHVAGTTLSGEFTLSEAEIEAYQQAVAAAKSDPVVVEESRRLQNEYYELKTGERAEIHSISIDEAKRLYPAPDHPVGESASVDLFSDDTVYIRGKTISVEQLLVLGEKLDRTAIPDPIEGPSYGSSTAMFFHNDGKSPVINSFAHGVQTCFLLNANGRQDEVEEFFTAIDDADTDEHDLVKFSLRGMSAQFESEMLEHKFVLGKIAILGQWTVIFSPPNTGKTLIAFWLLILGIKNGDIDPEYIFYINADDSHAGLTTKLKLAEKYGFHMLAPGYAGFDTDDLLRLLKKLGTSGQARGTVVVLDTMKKFANPMDKTQCRHFDNGVREFVGKGGTVIGLAHTNKNRAADGKPVPAGTSDFLDDADCAYVMDTISDDNDIRTVEFENRKNRGMVAKQAAYQYSTADGQGYIDLLASVTPVEDTKAGVLREAASLRDDFDAPFIQAIVDCIEGGVTARTKIVEQVSAVTGESKRQAGRVLEKYTGTDPNLHYWKYTIGDRGVNTFELLPTPDDEVDNEEP
jgi:hypothetical protein